MSTDIVKLTDRATCWSLTINNYTDADINIELPAGWKLEGQPERGGEQGTLHAQLMLRTPQTRFAAVKKVFPRAHIEVARNAGALKKYVHKADTSAGEAIYRASSIPTLFEYQSIIADQWDEDEFQSRWKRACERCSRDSPDISAVAMSYLDTLVEADIESTGRRGAEFIAINPMWRSSWLRFWRSIINRQSKYNANPLQQEGQAPSSDGPPAQAWDGERQHVSAADSPALHL